MPLEHKSSGSSGSLFAVQCSAVSQSWPWLLDCLSMGQRHEGRVDGAMGCNLVRSQRGAGAHITHVITSEHGASYYQNINEEKAKMMRNKCRAWKSKWEAAPMGKKQVVYMNSSWNTKVFLISRLYNYYSLSNKVSISQYVNMHIICATHWTLLKA